jgi:aspartate carbamoyltransferase regulatory subunit
MALKVLKIIGVSGSNISSTVSVLMNAPSKKGGCKDVVKVEDRELEPSEVDKITLISPNVSINIIRNYNVTEKYKPKLPETIVGILRCPNPNCITNKEREPVKSKFTVISQDPLRVKCIYCGRMPEDIASNLL